MRRRPSTALAAVVVAALALGAGALAGAGGWGDPASEPPLVGGLERLAGVRFEELIGAIAPGLEAESRRAAIARGPKEPSAPAVLRPRMAQFSGDLRDLPRTRPKPLAAEGAEVELRGPARAAGSAQRPAAPIAPRGPAPAATTSAGLTFDDIGAGWPPDVNIDVGPTHVIETVNTGFAIYLKSDRSLIVSNSIDALFAGRTGTPCDDHNMGDPIVVYDTIADRWIISDFAWADDVNGPFYECLAVSKTGDPVAGGWWYYAYAMGGNPEWAPASDAYFPDYPKLGVWPDGIYMSLNVFAPDGSYSHARTVAFDRERLEAGVRADAIRFDLPLDGGLLPANARAQTGLPPTGTPGYFVEMGRDPLYIPGSDATALGVFAMHVDWSVPANSTISDYTSVDTVDWHLAPATAPSPGNDVDTLNDRLIMQAQYANIGGRESIWAAHAAGTDPASTAFLAWHQVDVTGGTIASTATQSALWAPADALNRFLPSIAVDRLGDAAMGYAVSNATTNPGIRYAGRLASDPADTFGYGERELQAGGGAQTVTSGGVPLNRWGDYASMTLDPSDGCTFWFAGEYYDAAAVSDFVPGGNWRTAISSFAYPSCRSKPTATTAPSISPTSSLRVGSVLTATRGAWTKLPTTYAYSWQRDDGTGWTTIPGAVAATYTVKAADVGRALRSRVTAVNPIGSTTAASARVVVPMKLVRAVALPSRGRKGVRLTAARAAWSAGVARRTYVWRRGGAVIAGATRSWYTPTAADRGRRITVVETVNGLFSSTSNAARIRR